PRPAWRAARDHRRRPRRARPRRVAARGGDPRRAPAAEAERRARRARVGARRGAGADRGLVSLELIRWDAPGPYDVVFSTRRGGVSEGPFAALNLGRKLGDVPERVEGKRRRLRSEVGA